MNHCLLFLWRHISQCPAFRWQSPPAAPVTHVLVFGVVYHELHLPRAARRELLLDDRRATTSNPAGRRRPIRRRPITQSGT